jgi:hypothetical protein
MLRALSVTGTVALSVFTLGIACGSEDDSGPKGSAGRRGNVGGTNGGGAGGVIGNGGTVGASGTGGTLGVGGVGGSSGIGGSSGRGGSSGSAGTNGSAGIDGSTGTGGTAGIDGSTGTGGTAGIDGSAGDADIDGSAGDAGIDGSAGTSGTDGGATCCPTGNCICRGTVPTSLTNTRGPHSTMTHNVSNVGCIHYPTNAQAPFSAVAISDGFIGTGGCGTAQTGLWGPLLASHGIVTMIIQTTGSDSPTVRGQKLLAGIAGFKAENARSGSPIFGKLAGRYATGGFSMGGGGTTRAASQDSSLLASLAIMPYQPVGQGVTVPTMFICGTSDNTASCTSHGTPAYNAMAASTAKIRVNVSSGHSGQPGAGGGNSGAWGLAFLKLYLDGDTRWKAVLLSGQAAATTIR